MSEQTRLPSTGAPRRRGGEVVLGLVALVGTAVIVVGVPIGLWLVAGTPWSPDLDDSILTNNASARDVVVVLTLVLWLVWAYFCMCVVVEAVAEARGGRIAPRLLGGGAGTQALARRLVGAIVLIGGTAASTTTTAHAISMPTDPGPLATASAQPATAGGSTDPVRRDAATTPTNEREFVPVEERATEGVVPYYDVKPSEGRNYETLWDIAERHLGSGLRYKEIFALNKGVVQPDGRALSDASLIHAGWVLRMPVDAHGPGVRVVDHRYESLEPAAVQPVSDPDDTVNPVETADHDGDTDMGVSAGHDPDHDSTPSWAPAFGVAGGLLAAGLVGRLRRYRASASVGSLASRRLDPPPNGATAPEAALRNEVAAGAAHLLNRGLRAWTATPTGNIPPIAQCSVSESAVAVSFHGTPSAAPPVGWQSMREGQVWTLRPDGAAALADATISPAPGLVTVGARDDGSALLLDLDAFRGVISIGGDSDRARSVAMSFALDTATHSWADRRQVTMVGFADDVTAVAEDTVRVVDDLSRAITSLERVADEQRHACARIVARTVHDARFVHADPDLWQHHLVVCSGVPDPESLRSLVELASEVRASIAVVIVGDVPDAATRLTASRDGRLTCPPLGVDVRAQAIDVDAYRGVVDVFERTLNADGDPEGPDAIAPTVDITEVEPSLLDETVRQPVEIRLLGPVRVDGPNEIAEPRRDLLSEIAAYVSLQPGGVHPDALDAAIWPRGIAHVTRDAELERVASWLGPDRFVQVDGLWQLRGPGVRVDWDVFRAYLDHADRMPRESVRALSAALDLVEGQAWADLPAGRYAWLAYEPAQVQIPALVVRTARRLATMLGEQGAADAARDALLRGLRMAPASEQLWCDALQLASRFASQRDVTMIADQMYATIAREGSPRGARAETNALVESLLPGYRYNAA